MNKTLLVMIPNELNTKLEEKKWEKRISKSAIVRIAIEEWINRN